MEHCAMAQMKYCRKASMCICVADDRDLETCPYLGVIKEVMRLEKLVKENNKAEEQNHDLIIGE